MPFDLSTAKPIKFDLSTAKPIEEPIQEPDEEKRGILETLGGIGQESDKIVGESLRGAGQRISERTQTIAAPTELGQLALRKTGAKGIAGQYVEGIAGLPERLFRTVGGAAGTIGEVAAVPAEILTKNINKLLGGKPGKIIQGAIEKGVNSEPGKKVTEAATKLWNDLSPQEKANYKSIPDMLSIIGLKGTQAVKPKISKGKFEDIVKSGVTKGIQPTRVKAPIVHKSAPKAVETIINNKKALGLTDNKGVFRLPKNADEFSKAIKQTKSDIYKQYHTQALKAGDKGAIFDLKNINNEIDKMTKSLSVDPETRKFITKQKEYLQELQGASPEIIEKRIQNMNAKMVQYYNPAVKTLHPNAQAAMEISKLMRKELDDKIKNAVGGQYAELKKQYGALKDIEEQVGRMAWKQAQDVGFKLPDVIDPIFMGEIIAGIATGQLQMTARGVSGKGAKELIKFFKKPDRKIKKMFDLAGGITESVKKTSLTPGLGVTQVPIASGVSRGFTKDDLETLKTFNAL